MSARRVFPNFHQIVANELMNYFTAKAKEIEAQAATRDAGLRLKLLGVDPEWRVGEALNALPDKVFVCTAEGCDRPVICHSWDEREHCDEHFLPKPKPETK